ncbi:MAG: hypothetical protein OQK35_02730 [Alphaproteobacteria bacterium]|nr:hypothetical protein [Alphaproteobacteria bacterium]
MTMPTTPNYKSPLIVAIGLTLIGEAGIFIVFGTQLFPAGNWAAKAVWTGTCGLAMGAVIGALVNIFVTGRLEGVKAETAIGAITLVILSFCNLLCFKLDLELNLFGAHAQSDWFLINGFAGALLMMFLYPWLIATATGQRILERVNL